MAKEAPKGAVVIGTKKIRFYPEKESHYHQAIDLSRRAENLSVENYKENKHVDKDGKFVDQRIAIKKQTKFEQAGSGRIYASMIVAEAVLKAKKTFFSVCKSNKGKSAGHGLAQMRFNSKKKGPRHTFYLDRLPKSGKPVKSILGDIKLTESIPDEAIGKQFSVSFEKGRWHINVQQHIKLKTEIQGKVKCVAIDPGVRTFATCYSENEVIIAGDNFAKNKLFPLMKEADQVLSYRQRVYNQFPKNTKHKDLPQWARNRLAFLQKRFYAIKCKKDDLVRDLHQKLAFYLVQNYDVIMLPHYESKKMVRRKSGRVIRRNTCRQMLSLGNYQFKLMLEWYAKKYGKTLVHTNESYTSKTLSWCGEVLEKIGGSKTVSDGKIKVDRDINGARGIYIKTLQCLSDSKRISVQH